MLKFIKNNLFAILISTTALVIGVYTRLILPQLAYTEFLGEQARESFMHSEIWNKGLPAYGPISSIGKYYIPSGYYILLFCFSFWSDNPSIHALSNSICSFLTIPLFGFLIYRAFNAFKNSILIAAFGSLLWSIFACDIFFGGFVWNPNSVTFFWMLLICIFELIYSQTLSKKYTPILWFVTGLVFGILIGLHSSTLFIIPFVFLVNAFYISYIQKSPKFLWSLPGFLLVMSPYLILEMQTNFQNTGNIFNTVFNQTKEPHTLVEKLNHVLDPILTLATDVYFAQTKMPMVSFTIVIATILLGIIFYKGRLFYLFNYILILGLFLLASNSYWGPLYRHYLVLVWSLPLFFVISLLFTISQNQVRKYTAIGLLILGFSFFAQQNMEGIYNIYQNKFGANRVVNVEDMKLAIGKMSPNQTICSPIYGNSLKYLNFIANGSIQTAENCKSGDFEFVENYKPSDFYLATKNTYNTANVSIFYKSDSFVIVKLK
jgi:hypothetical protein